MHTDTNKVVNNFQIGYADILYIFHLIRSENVETFSEEEILQLTNPPLISLFDTYIYLRLLEYSTNKSEEILNELEIITPNYYTLSPSFSKARDSIISLFNSEITPEEYEQTQQLIVNELEELLENIDKIEYKDRNKNVVDDKIEIQDCIHEIIHILQEIPNKIEKIKIENHIEEEIIDKMNNHNEITISELSKIIKNTLKEILIDIDNLYYNYKKMLGLIL